MKIAARRALFAGVSLAILLSCNPQDAAETPENGGDTPAPRASEPQGNQTRDAQTGTATVYAGMLEGRETAGGEAFSHDELVAAHRTHPLGTRVRVTNLENDRSVTVRIVDRTPAGTGTLIDLSRRAAQELGIGERGQARVRVEVLD